MITKKKVKLSIGLLLIILSLYLPIPGPVSEFVILVKLAIFVAGLFLIMSCMDIPSESEKPRKQYDQDGHSYDEPEN